MHRKSQQTKVLPLDNVSPATRLLEKRRQMFEVQEALEQQKAEFERKARARPLPSTPTAAGGCSAPAGVMLVMDPVAMTPCSPAAWHAHAGRACSKPLHGERCARTPPHALPAHAGRSVQAARGGTQKAGPGPARKPHQVQQVPAGGPQHATCRQLRPCCRQCARAHCMSRKQRASWAGGLRRRGPSCWHGVAPARMAQQAGCMTSRGARTL